MIFVESACWPPAFQNYVHALLSRHIVADGKKLIHCSRGLLINKYIAAQAHTNFFMCLARRGSSPNLGLLSAALIEINDENYRFFS